MKLGEIVNHKAGIEFAYRLKLKDGARAIKLRRTIMAMDAELRSFDDVKNEYIKATGRDAISPADKEYPEVLARINEAASVEVGVTVEPLILESDLEGVEVSAQVIDSLIAVGLMQLEESGDVK